MPGLTVGVLGQLEVTVDGSMVRLTTGRLRTLLAALAVTAGQTVSMQRLTVAVWADEPPENPRRSLQTYAARLRAEVGDRVVSSQGDGLMLDVEIDAVDALRFDHLVDVASRQAAPERERQLLDEALRLWRGEPFEGVTSRWLAETEAPRLVERRLRALERRVDLDLVAARHDELVGELNEWTVRYPMRESLWVRMLVALDRCGRRADALERYEMVRSRIADELGVDPSPELQQVYANLLADRPAPSNAASTARRPTPVIVPQQLPAPPSAFTGRAAELARLDDIDDLDDSSVAIIAIDGMAGVGKTALAVQAARQLAGRYPDGQLFLDLHGFTEGVAPVDPHDALDRMLRSLGVPGEQIPPHLDDRAALYRSYLADRQMLILLDNAATEAQVKPLLPGSPGCLALVTSRRRLAGLDQTHAVSLDVLPPTDARNLFTKAAGVNRLAGEPTETLLEIVELCGRLPLAVRIAAARLRAHHTWNAEHLLDLMYDRQQRLGELETGERSVTAALDLSYQQLTGDQQRTYRLIGLHPGSDLDLYAAAALLDTDLRETRRLLDQLLDAHLLEEPTPDRYQFHDLVRHHAALLATRDEPGAARDGATTRLFTYYAEMAAVAMNVAYPFEQERRPQPPASSHPVPDVHTTDLATSWLDIELPNLLAAATYSADHGWLDYPPRLAATLDLHLMNRSSSDAEALHQLALSSARAAADPIAELNALVSLGLIHRRASEYPQAEANYRQVLLLAREHGHRPGEMDALHGLGQMRRLQGLYAEATDSFHRALDIAGSINYPTGQMQALLGLGHTYRDLGRHELAAEYLRRSLALSRETRHHVCELDALYGLGWTHLAHDDYEQAGSDFGHALDIARSSGHRTGQLTCLLGLGCLYRKEGRHEMAAGVFGDILDQARQLGRPNWIFEALQGLGRTRLSLGSADDALTHHQNALDIATEMGQPSDIARAHDGIAHAYRALQEHDKARRHWQQALDTFNELGIDSTPEDWEASVSAIRGHLDAYAT